MPVKDTLDAIEGRSDLSPAQKRAQKLQAKADAVGAEMVKLAGKTFVLDGVRWTVEEAAVEGPLVKAVLSAKRGTQPLLTADDPRNPFYWHNPPTQVSDGTTRQEAHPITGVLRPVPNYKEDLVEAAKALLRGIDL